MGSANAGGCDGEGIHLVIGDKESGSVRGLRCAGYVCLLDKTVVLM